MNTVIIGAGSVGQHIVINKDEYENIDTIIGFLDDDVHKHGKSFYGVKVLGGIDELRNFNIKSIVIGIAFPDIKIQVIDKVLGLGEFKFPRLISKSAWVSKGVDIGEGTIVYPNTSINYGSSIGKHVVMNMNCALGHHTVVGDFSSLAPGVCTGGHTHIGKAVEMGINSSTIQGIYIGDKAVIGGATMVIKNVGASQRCVGVPGVNFS